MEKYLTVSAFRSESTLVVLCSLSAVFMDLRNLVRHSVMRIVLARYTLIVTMMISPNLRKIIQTLQKIFYLFYE